MLRIRFLRAGKKNRPFFRIVATDSTNPPQGGRFKEKLGFFDPLKKEVKLKSERIKYWISVGAQPSDRVHNLLIKEGIIKGKKVAVHSRSKKQVSEVEKEKEVVVEAPKEEKEKAPEKEEKKEIPEEEKEKTPEKEKIKEEISSEKKETSDKIEKVETKIEVKKEQKKDFPQEKLEEKKE
jgi:small subunit ribosomal protein S16